MDVKKINKMKAAVSVVIAASMLSAGCGKKEKYEKTEKDLSSSAAAAESIGDNEENNAYSEAENDSETSESENLLFSGDPEEAFSPGGEERLKSMDSDSDGISDYDEIKVYGTDPDNPDTDGDELSDPDEIDMGLDPNNADTDGNQIPDGEEYVEQTVNEDRFEKSLMSGENAAPVELVVKAKGNVNRNLTVSEYNGYLKGDSRAYVGVPIILEGAEIDGGSITFKLPDEYVIRDYSVEGIDDAHTNGLLICRYDENGEDMTVPLETQFDEKERTLTAEVSGAGIYFILDVMSYMDELGIEY